jgi:hypothetical protein
MVIKDAMHTASSRAENLAQVLSLYLKFANQITHLVISATHTKLIRDTQHNDA